MLEPTDRGVLRATSQAITGVNSSYLREQPSRLLHHPSHFGPFFHWAGCETATVRSTYGKCTPGAQPVRPQALRDGPLPGKAADKEAVRKMNDKDQLATHASKSAAETASNASAERSKSLRVNGQPSTATSDADASMSRSSRACSTCGNSTAKPGVCHWCWFETWDSVVQLRNLKRKAAARQEANSTGRSSPSMATVGDASPVPSISTSTPLTTALTETRAVQEVGLAVATGEDASAHSPKQQKSR
eukprot:scaffold286157_cov30-Tisochrysis_lutea.AAC.3